MVPQHPDNDYLNEMLLKSGLIGTAPLHPPLAIPIATLDMYCHCRLCSPQFSIQQWVWVLCDIANVSPYILYGFGLNTSWQINYRESLREQFSEAFDIYLELIRCLDHAIKIQLGWASPTWRILHGCPPCQYKVRFYHMLTTIVHHEYLAWCRTNS